MCLLIGDGVFLFGPYGSGREFSMPKLNREDELYLSPSYLGKNSKYKYQEIYDHMRKHMKLKDFHIWALLMYKRIYMDKKKD